MEKKAASEMAAFLLQEKQISLRNPFLQLPVAYVSLS
jgi:hypothetical protein